MHGWPPGLPWLPCPALLACLHIHIQLLGLLLPPRRRVQPAQLA
jgi:hypothetical protein